MKTYQKYLICCMSILLSSFSICVYALDDANNVTNNASTKTEKLDKTDKSKKLLPLKTAKIVPLKLQVTDPLKPIVVKKSSPIFSIILQSNKTTGYSWQLKGFDAALITPVSAKYIPPQNGLIGAGGYEKWTFKVKSEGFVVPQITNIVMIYSRPWELQGANATSFKVVTTDVD